VSEPDAVLAGVAAFDMLPDHEAAALLATCCGATEWVHGMTARRPFGTLAVLLQASDELWWSLAPDDWREAFDHHPRIGEQRAAAPQSAEARRWSSDEQRGASVASADVRQALAAGNDEYERRFGHIYLVSAAGRSADELLGMLRSRLTNDPTTELRVAAGEQAKITRLRLQKLFGATPSTSDA
jgi:OHCU decarboxylase